MSTAVVIEWVILPEGAASAVLGGPRLGFSVEGQTTLVKACAILVAIELAVLSA